MKVGVGYSDNPNSKIAGQEAAQVALAKAGREDTCDITLLFCTARHDQALLREGVTEVVGNSHCVYGGGSVGIITNDTFGYAGDQVGIACIWLEDSSCTILTEENLHESEIETGKRLGKRLAELGTTKTSPVMLFYDALDWTQGPLRLLMATWLLEGIEQGLGFLPDLTGAGMQGDHVCTPTQQFIGDKMQDHTAFAMAFSDDIRIDSVIMHGCRPASPYYTVTKADGSTILEINHEPAIPFMNKLLSPELTPEQYPFFLLFGINHGERWAEYDENNYASRLCLGIDKERNGIVMFEPDMVAGTEFQIMFRSLGLDYMKPKIDSLFDKVGDREPVFAMYIDCAGRCAGYGGVDIEDAYVIQEAVGQDIPLLGLYTGVEIASIGGKPRGLDWTGVFCIFSKSKDGALEETNTATEVWENQPKEGCDTEEVIINALENLCIRDTAKILALDTQSIAIRQELEQKRRGFKLLAELAVSLRQGNSDEDNFLYVTQRINAALNMQKTAVLVPDGTGNFTPLVLQGYGTNEFEELRGKTICVEDAFLDPENAVIVTAADEEVFKELRTTLKLPYFVSSPIVVQGKVAAILITGRTVESTPFMSRLGHTAAETVQAICALLASVLVYQQLDDANKRAQTDALTGLYNRRALEGKASELLRQDLPNGSHFAFILIDFDYFKQVNDNFGHLVGDTALKALSATLQESFRSTDIIARLGGDEFAVFCKLASGDAAQIANKITQLMENWSKTPLAKEDGTPFFATISVGISVAPKDETTYEGLLHKADIALYKSKELGRNRFTIYDAETM